MPVDNLYSDFRATFPEVTRLADREHIREWDYVEPEMAFSWFESLAKAINLEMSKAAPIEKYLPVFEFFRKSFMLGAQDEKKCIDASFVENLFWGVDKEKKETYWLALPDVLKELYIAFHGREPA